MGSAPPVESLLFLHQNVYGLYRKQILHNILTNIVLRTHRGNITMIKNVSWGCWEPLCISVAQSRNQFQSLDVVAHFFLHFLPSDVLFPSLLHLGHVTRPLNKFSTLWLSLSLLLLFQIGVMAPSACVYTRKHISGHWYNYKAQI